jgi:hypothetical protein
MRVTRQSGTMRPARGRSTDRRVSMHRRDADYTHSYGIEQKGRPRGVKGGGATLTRFIAHLEFAARASGGAWTLNKNDERGTLIEALEILTPMLPDEFLPPKESLNNRAMDR